MCPACIQSVAFGVAGLMLSGSLTALLCRRALRRRDRDRSQRSRLLMKRLRPTNNAQNKEISSWQRAR
jgi:hypothetical protein